MGVRYRVLVLSALLVLSPHASSAQVIDLAAGGAEQTWRGPDPGSRAGLWLDAGALSADGRRDLVVGAPGDAGTLGKVFVLFGGPIRTGSFSLSSAEARFTGALPGDQFGLSTAVGNILTDEVLEPSRPRNLVVGAPAAGPNSRGAVYLFSAGLTEGQSVNASSAVLTIYGAPFDRLGTALGTADLNGDNYREIVIGAAGSNKVYVIDVRNGGQPLTGVIDLERTAATAVITGPGIGSVITAGDITGDGVFDLVLGAPTVNDSRGAVYVVAGRRTGGFSGTLPVPANAAALYLGIDPNDLAGSSVKIGDFINDSAPNSRWPDLAIGAPGGDGPTGARTDSGEVYIIRGLASGLNSTGLVSAPVTIFGDANNARLGAHVSAGDVNRDAPDDLVLLAPGAAASTGQLAVYYGRTYNTMGVALPDGRRQIDFAAPGQMDRRILSDAAAGPLVTSQVFEVTGEGARDIIVSAPYATTEVGALSGYIYFTISPKLNLSRTSLQFGTMQGSSASTTLQVRNASSIEVTWRATSTQSWLTFSPGTGSAVNTAPATMTLSGAAGSMAPGTYSATLNVISTSRHLELTRPLNVTLNVFGRPVVTANTSFPAQAGTPITFTATVPGASPGTQYKFWRYRVGGGWTMVQDYGTANTFAWTPGAADVGEHSLQVWVRSAGSTESHEAFGSTDYFTITRPVPVLTSLTTNVAFPAPPGSTITWTATATGGLAPLQYKFWRFKTGGGWTMARDWNASNTYTWTPGSADEGNYNLQVWVRNSGATGDPDAWRAMEFTISRTPPVMRSIVANRSFPSGTGSAITWTALASGGTAGPLQYKFWRYNTTTGTWTVVQDYSAVNTWTWTPGYNDTGSYVLQVWVRSAGSTASHETYGATDPFTITRTPVSVTSFTASTAFPAASTTTITWTAQASGGGGPLEYKFWRYKSGVGWTMVQDYSTTNTFTWTPGAGGAGSYQLQVWVRTVGSGASHEDYRAMEFTIQ